MAWSGERWWFALLILRRRRYQRLFRRLHAVVEACKRCILAKFVVSWQTHDKAVQRRLGAHWDIRLPATYIVGCCLVITVFLCHFVYSLSDLNSLSRTTFFQLSCSSYLTRKCSPAAYASNQSVQLLPHQRSTLCCSFDKNARYNL